MPWPMNENSIYLHGPARVLTKYVLAGRIAVRNRLAYPAEMLGPVMTFSLILFVFMRIWAVAFEGKTDIGGWSQHDLCWYFLFAELVVFSSGGAFANFSADIKDGQIAYTMCRPFSVLLYAASQRLGLGLVNILFFLPPGALIVTLSVGWWNPPGMGPVLLGFVSLVLGITLQFSAHLVLSLTAFWLEENSALYWIWSKFTLVIGTLIPLEFLPEAWQSVVVWTPFPWIMWAPGKILADWPGAGTALRVISIQVVILGLYALIGWVVFRAAVRKLKQQGG